MTIKIVAHAALRPGVEEEFLNAARSCIEASRAEPGVLRYELWREVEGERRFVFDETYADPEAVGSHLSSAHYLAFQATLSKLLAGPPEVLVTGAVDVRE